jgi:hypothetical protein
LGSGAKYSIDIFALRQPALSRGFEKFLDILDDEYKIQLKLLGKSGEPNG